MALKKKSSCVVVSVSDVKIHFFEKNLLVVLKVLELE